MVPAKKKGVTKRPTKKKPKKKNDSSEGYKKAKKAIKELWKYKP